MNIQIKTDNNQILTTNFLTFSGGERHVQLSDTDVSPFSCITIEARIQDTTDVMDLLLLVNALQHKFGQNTPIHLTLPYLPYARQDRVCAAGQAFSLEVFAGLLNSMALRRLTVWDCHSQVGIDLTQAINITPEKIIATHSELVEQLTSDNSVLVCPDQGAKARCTAIQEYFALPSMVQCYKKRDSKTGHITKTEIEAPSLTGKTAIITDDICDGGFTFIKIAEQLKAKGASQIILYVTHGIFSNGFQVFDGLIDKIYTTDSFPQNADNSMINVIHYS
ncbi:ribose-phosphate diphosphokinase [Vibrio rhizosphaerae]|uniref:ribose-phosphate diphosphokinase n=1 Tax=Vibrio rhizosphaerae TaxID=398736 RepID=UPI00056E5A64|nr:ribose-phosphate diphosphokinase [Vibrio rhizosphaerae]